MGAALSSLDERTMPKTPVSKAANKWRATPKEKRTTKQLKSSPTHSRGDGNPSARTAISCLEEGIPSAKVPWTVRRHTTKTLASQ